MEQQARRVDEEIARIASRTHGVVTRKSLLGKGVSPQQIRRRLERGSLIAVHRGVYRVGHQAPTLKRTTWEPSWRAAMTRGDEFRRYTWGDVFEDPAAMLAELRMLLPTAG